MELHLNIDGVKYDFEAKQDGDQVVPGEPLFLVTFGVLALSRAEYLELVANAKDHTIKVKTEG